MTLADKIEAQHAAKAAKQAKLDALHEAAVAEFTGPATTCVETVLGDPSTALRLSFQIKVF